MSTPHSLLLPVTDPSASADFYAMVLGMQTVEASPTFVLMAFPSGLMLGLWRKDGILPTPTPPGGSGEIGLRVDDGPAVDRLHEDWAAKGAAILLPPTDMDFGRCFVAADPDGHRLRIYALAE